METIKDESNNLEFFGLYTLVTLTILNTNLLRNITKIQRDSNIQNITICSIPDHLLTTDLSKPKKHMINKEFSIYMNTFLKEIKTNIPGVNLSAFIENTKNFGFEMKTSIFQKILNNFSVVASFYSDATGKNRIIFYNSKIKKNIWHEFLHMASQRRSSNCIFSGFSQKIYSPERKTFKNIGNYLNEGYTEVLAKRYFTEHGGTGDSYLIEKNLANILEYIVGKDNMEHWYFSSDLPSLLYELSKYDSIANILKLLKNIDIIGEHRTNFGLVQLTKKMYKSTLWTLLSWYYKKIKLDVQSGEKIEGLDPEVLKLFTKNINKYSSKFKGLSLEEIKKYIVSNSEKKEKELS